MSMFLRAFHSFCFACAKLSTTPRRTPKAKSPQQPQKLPLGQHDHLGELLAAQVQKLLGHARIDTTMHYAMVDQNNVKASHRKYLE